MAKSTRLMKILSYKLIVFMAVMCLYGDVFAQGCCSASGRAGQVGVFQQSGQAPGQVALSLFYEYASGDRLLEGSREIDDPISRNSRFDAVVSSISVGLPYRFSAHAAIPVVRRERSLLIGFDGGEDGVSLAASGFADPTITLIREISPVYGWNGWYMTAGLGVQLPLGNDGRLDQGIPLPPDIQPATGSWNLTLLASVSKDLDDYLVYHHLTWTTYGSNDFDYSFGNSISADLGLSVSRFGALEPFVRLDLLRSQADKRGGWESPNTGVTRWTVFPGVVYSLRDYGLTFSGQAGIPLHERVNGFQLGTDIAMLFGVSYLM